AWFVLEAALINGSPLMDLPNGDVVFRLAAQTLFGRVWMIRILIAIVLIVLLVADGRVARGRPRSSMALGATILAGLYLAMLAVAGHAAAGQGADRLARVAADAIHLLAAGCWLGTLPGLVLLLASARRTAAVASIDVAAAAIRRFSALGLASVGALIVSGIVNSWYLVGDVPAMFGTDYGRLLTTKLALFFAMVALATANRYRLTPRVAARDFVALHALLRTTTMEIAAGIAVVAIVAALGVTVPAAHEPTIWPFAFTLHVEAVDSAARISWFVAVVIAALCAGAALVLARARHRRLSVFHIAIAGVAIGIAAAVTCPYLSVVQAYPTTYVVSPLRYSTTAIAQGATVYAENCAQCHGAHGRGDGALAASLSDKPPDLVLHSMHHSAGDMFWWIAHGIPRTAMPEFGARLPDAAIWSVIEFIRAQAQADDARTMTTHVEPWRPLVAPDFTFELAGPQESLKEERERNAVLFVLYALPQSLDRLRALAADQPKLAKAGMRVIAVPVDASSRAIDTTAAGPRSMLAVVGPDVAATYAMFAASDESNTHRATPVHVEFLIDRQGYLRARWLSVPADQAERTREILAQASLLNEEPPREPVPEGHLH
ncbi:MAG TPA: CopD family protein, partial [Casimicrobiaceae bacterium]|nr:CopD family protein [Casimicrobiaceae bacterium]